METSLSSTVGCGRPSFVSRIAFLATAAAVDEEHTASGAHRTTEIPFPEWVPVEDMTAASLLTVDDALDNSPPACVDPVMGGELAHTEGRQHLADELAGTTKLPDNRPRRSLIVPLRACPRGALGTPARRAELSAGRSLADATGGSVVDQSCGR